ncbi:hypothetical protein CASFOL_020024 [Castilleja foliolosa]|uniref:DUF674 family protein n=1 Tax=Castilleja foliolosa TaxID=1961234 RepID=A0ABD3D3V3_9LAMI
MSDLAKDVKFSLKVMINEQKTEVLFAEIDSDLADVLLSFLTLPLGTIVRIMKKHYGDEAPVFGSITTLNDGLSYLDSSHFWTEAGKEMLLNPTSSFIDECRKLKLDVGENQPIKYFTCENRSCFYPRSKSLGIYYDIVKCDCGKQLKREISVRNVSNAVDGEVFTMRTATFLITDDLDIWSNETTSVKDILDNLGIMDIDGAELRNLTFGFNEIMDLLKYSLISPTPLTNVVLKQQNTYKLDFSFHWIGKKTTVVDNSVRKLKVILQKSTNKFLFAEASEDFIEILFSFLVISLGGVQSLLGTDSSLENIDNLYSCVEYPIDEKNPNSHERSRLLSPPIPYGYFSKKWIFPLTEEEAPKLRYTASKNEEYLIPGAANCTFKSPRGEANYINGPRKYMVKDDLTVTPLCLTSYINTLNEQKISFSDVEELVLNIGLEEK